MHRKSATHQKAVKPRSSSEGRLRVASPVATYCGRICRTTSGDLAGRTRIERFDMVLIISRARGGAPDCASTQSRSTHAGNSVNRSPSVAVSGAGPGYAPWRFALPMVALVSVLTALDAYFNWRSRWILMQETQYRLQRPRDKMDYYLVTTPEAKVGKAALDEFFGEQQAIWADISTCWIEYYRAEKLPRAASEGESA